ncbi:hypothetical protein AMEX_G4584 [Astyanax mexicanus]|uniref:Uncharacterized protein n=1 Tax=Astyanax mexicanus TaxID=7994 RepID=A0A8T2MB61_ASTMX|nr:hypothetical protein AMEX_G4584 [Astyanax mexicanus]
MMATDGTVEDSEDGPGCFENSLEIKRPNLCAKESAGFEENTKVKHPDSSADKRNQEGEDCCEENVHLSVVEKLLLLLRGKLSGLKESKIQDNKLSD